MHHLLHNAAERSFYTDISPAPEINKIAVLYSELSGYMAACLKALKMYHGVELLVFKWPVVDDAPFDESSTFGWIDHLHEKTGQPAEEILRIVTAFAPQGLFIPGWIDPDYLKVATVMKRRGIPVIAGSDTCWTGSLRQWVSKYLSPLYLHSAIDILWVAGERQRVFARRLGFAGEKCWSGLYACDWDSFAAELPIQMENRDPVFIYTGRYVAEKGIVDLVDAYKIYRAVVKDPWKLICLGSGRLKHLLADQEGLIDEGFVQPRHLPLKMKRAAAFILPSRVEPWGVALHEAASSGMPLIGSDACGAAINLLQDGYNGYLFEAGNSAHLAAAMVKMSTASVVRRTSMAMRSFALSKQFTPALWAEKLVAGLRSLQSEKQGEAMS